MSVTTPAPAKNLTEEEQKAYDEGFEAYARRRTDRYYPSALDCHYAVPQAMKPDSMWHLRSKFIRGWKDAKECY